MATKRLKGDELLKLAERLKGKPASEVMEQAGYFTLRNGRKSFNQKAFNQALLEARGLSFIDDVSAGGGAGREPTYTLKVGAKSLIPVSGCYGRKLGLDQGDHVQVEVFDKPGKFQVEGPCMVLYQTEEADEGEGEAKPTLKAVA